MRIGTFLKCFFFVFFLVPLAAVGEEQQLDISTILMRSTFKLESEGALGSVFIMGEPSPYDTNKLYFVLLTAAHVLEGMKSDVAVLHLRKREGDKFIRLPYPVHIRNKGTPAWTRHPDADVAAIRIRLPKDADIQLISTALLGTDKTLEEFQVHPGDQLFVLGFPYGAEANDEGFPVLRSGRIANYPLTPTKTTKTFLLDFPVFKGNSGGPVLFYAENRIYGGGMHSGSIQFIIGIVSQERLVTERVQSLGETIVREHTLGLAVITHAGFVADVLKLLPPIQKETP